MDNKDRSIATQVAFKGAIDLAVAIDLDLANPAGQAQFEESFSYLTESLFKAITSQLSAVEQMAQVIQGQFPGSQVVSGPAADQYAQPSYTQPGPPQFTLTVKGDQHGPLPDWLFEQAASKGVTEVYDNRLDAMQNPDKKRPWFRATTGGRDAPAFWPPR